MELNDISNLDRHGEVLPRDDRARLFGLGNRLWHSDSSFKEIPAKFSLLSARRIPAAGGNTEFVDTRIVYDDLPAAAKARIAGLRAIHDFWHSHAGGRHFMVTDEMRRRMPPVPQPLVRTLPGGRKALCIGSHATHIEGLPLAEGRELLDELAAFATQPKYVYSHPWRKGDLVIWDNRTTLHRAAPWDDRGKVRDLRRTSINESGPEIAATDRH